MDAQDNLEEIVRMSSTLGVMIEEHVRQSAPKEAYMYFCEMIRVRANDALACLDEGNR